MHIVTAEEMRELDLATFSKLNIPSYKIMEKAGNSVAEFVAHFANQKKIIVVCGGGNNAGDAYIAATKLFEQGFEVEVVALKPLKDLKNDAQSASLTWRDLGREVLDKFPKEITNPENTIILDGIFGTGFRGEIPEKWQSIVETINLAKLSGAEVISIDVPSGLDASSSEVSGLSVKASKTICIQHLKICHVCFPASEYCGEIYLVDIGIISPEIELRKLITSETVSEILINNLKPNPTAHKNTRGNVLVIGGSAGHYGAPKMSGLSALKSGVGLATIALPETGAKIIGPELFELMCLGLTDDGNGAIVEQDNLEKIFKNKTSIVIGPGMGTDKRSGKFLEQVIEEAKAQSIQLVIDADALNLIALSKNKKSLLKNQIITPHPGEMSRLIGIDSSETQKNRIEIARKFSEEFSCTTVLKGARTVIASSKGKIWINPMANELLATAGSGDALAGIISALVSKGLSAVEACIVGCFIHGLTAEVFLAKGPALGASAMDLIDLIPEATSMINKKIEKSSDIFKNILPFSIKCITNHWN